MKMNPLSIYLSMYICMYPREVIIIKKGLYQKSETNKGSEYEQDSQILSDRNPAYVL